MNKSIIKNIKSLLLITATLITLNCLTLIKTIKAVTPHVIKDTHSILKKEYQPYSLLNGAVYWETMLARQIYDKGYPDDATTKLTRRFLFHKVLESFDISKQENTAAQGLTIPKIGITIGIIANTIRSHVTQKDFVEQLNKALNVANPEIDNLILERKKTKEKIKPLNKVKFYENIISEKVPYFKKFTIGTTTIEQPLTNGMKQQLQQEIYQLKPALSSLEKQLKIISSKIETLEQQKQSVFIGTTLFQNFANLLYRSLEECGHFSTKETPKYLPFTTTNLLLAVLYRKMSTKHDYKQYLDSLLATLEISSDQFYSTTPPPIDWNTNIFNDNDVTTVLKEIKEMAEQPDVINWIYKNIERVCFAEIMNQYYQRTMPKFSYHNPSTRYENTTFTDCVENSIRNMCNILLYNSQHKIFSLKELPSTIDQSNLLPTLVDFYKKYPSVINTDPKDKPIHDDWAAIVSNIPWATYNKILSKNQQIQPATDHPFIFTPSESISKEIKIGKYEFTSTGNDKHKLYEISLNKGSLVVIFNHLLGLNLFNNPSEAYEKDLFPSLCKKLKWTVEKEELTKPPFLKIHFTTDRNQKFKLSMSSQHSEVNPKIQIQNHSQYRETISNIILKNIETICFSDIYNLTTHSHLISIFKEGIINRSKSSRFYEGFPCDYACADPYKYASEIATTCMNLRNSYKEALIQYYYFSYPIVIVSVPIPNIGLPITYSDPLEIIYPITKSPVEKYKPFINLIKRIIQTLGPKQVAKILNKIQNNSSLIKQLYFNQFDKFSENQKAVILKKIILLQVKNIDWFDKFHSTDFSKISTARKESLILEIFYPNWEICCNYNKNKIQFRTKIDTDIKENLLFIDDFFNLIMSFLSPSFNKYNFCFILDCLDKNDLLKQFVAKNKSILTDHFYKLITGGKVKFITGTVIIQNIDNPDKVSQTEKEIIQYVSSELKREDSFSESIDLETKQLILKLSQDKLLKQQKTYPTRLD
jgi:hypothetical protein